MHSFRTTAFCLLLTLLPVVTTAQAETWLQGRVTHVRDVDTIVVGNVPIRLNGLDGPELSEPKGKEARTWLVKLLHKSTVKCSLNGDTSYDRVIGVCYLLDGTDIGELAVRSGYARDCPRFSGGRYRQFETAKSKRLPSHNYCKVR